ncbi:hypothetical protein FHS77_002679 [Paenochrobactrum gallinarii]|uniref:Uncharacterized protein n=1 Tax=Paenochrobactrum gallinarii TaxID=643673 RepID=A0A841M779_9HYPH|nr:hypothetical protein [Paenochrobactrum gallinarii]MBB6262111.1 hypothetical protein [Paenochrobactrum gallinarii]
MTEKLRFTRAQMRNMAIIAKEEGVSVTVKPDGSISVLPVSAAPNDATRNNHNDIVLL